MNVDWMMNEEFRITFQQSVFRQCLTNWIRNLQLILFLLKTE